MLYVLPLMWGLLIIYDIGAVASADGSALAKIGCTVSSFCPLHDLSCHTYMKKHKETPAPPKR